MSHTANHTSLSINLRHMYHQRYNVHAYRNIAHILVHVCSYYKYVKAPINEATLLLATVACNNVAVCMIQCCVVACCQQLLLGNRTIA